MVKLPYVSEYQTFTRSEYKQAEEILAEYNDFYIFNMAQYASIYHDAGVPDDEEEEVDLLKRQEQADNNAKAATEHFKELFGSKDFGESCLIGYRPAWYDLQKILFDEYKKKTPITESAMNEIAPSLRRIASVLLFGERLTSLLADMDCEVAKINAVKNGFNELLLKVSGGRIEVPEYCKEKKIIGKFKKAEQILEYAQRLCR